MPGGSGASGESPSRSNARAQRAKKLGFYTGGKYITKSGKLSKVNRENAATRAVLKKKTAAAMRKHRIDTRRTRRRQHGMMMEKVNMD